MTFFPREPTKFTAILKKCLLFELMSFMLIVGFFCVCVFGRAGLVVAAGKLV